MNEASLILSEKDYKRLTHIFNNLDEGEIEHLFIEIERAQVVNEKDIPADVVTMNSKVEYQDMTTGKANIITIVYPDNANASEKKISILTSVGSALIGLRENQEISWTFPNGDSRKLKVIKVHYQPEASGDWNL